MNAKTRKLILAAIGGGLLALGLLSGYNFITADSPLFSIPALIFLIGAVAALWKAFG